MRSAPRVNWVKAESPSILSMRRCAKTASFADGTAAEDEALADLLMGEEQRASLYAFDLVQRRAKRPAGAPDKALARPVTKVHRQARSGGDRRHPAD